jgi:hypothetical protein
MKSFSSWPPTEAAVHWASVCEPMKCLRPQTRARWVAVTSLGLALAFAALLAASPAFAAARKTPAPLPTAERGAAQFYAAYIRLHPSGIPDARRRTRLMPFLTQRLYALLQAGERAENRYAEATKHESPPIVEGDMFTSLFEGATSFSVTSCMATGEKTATCTVSLTYKSEGQPDTSWTDTVSLVREERRFRVDEITFGGAWPFANKGTLSDLVNDAISQSEMPQN